MGIKKTVGNKVMVKLDPDNNTVTTKSGIKLYVDTSYEPEKHQVVTGTVVEPPKDLKFSKKDGSKMPWDTTVELKEGDKVAMYYLAVQNCLRKEHRRYIEQDGEKFIFIAYNNIYAAIREGKIIPVNGYLLIEPVDDPEIERQKKKAEAAGLAYVPLSDEKSATKVVYGRVVYVGTLNKDYYTPDLTDEGADVSVGDTVIMKKVRDIPIEYELHAKIDGGRKLYRVQRHEILAVL